MESVVALANALTLDLVIEGVETLTEREALLRAGASKGRVPVQPPDAAGRRAGVARLGRGVRGSLATARDAARRAASDYTVPASSAAPSPSVSTSLRSHRPSPSVST